MKLNVGCGSDFRPGWLNVDCRPLYPTGTEFLCDDLRALNRHVADATADEIVAINVLEYVPWREVDAALVALAKALRPGGLLELQVPDLEAVAGDFWVGNLTADLAQRAIFGEQGYPEEKQQSLWTAALVERRLTMIGVQVEHLVRREGQLYVRGRRLL